MRLFSEHPAAVGESYATHGRTAAGFGLRLLAAGAACWVHALVPALFPDAASRTVRDLNDELGRRSATRARA